MIKKDQSIAAATNKFARAQHESNNGVKLETGET